MAGNFWLSSHHHQWILTQEEILIERQTDLKSLTNEEYQKLMIFFCRFIQSLGEHLKLRQQVIATGTVYFRRFYARNSLKCIDPLLLAPTCIFLAAKVEECGVITNTKLISGCTAILKSKFAFAFPTITEFPYRINQVFIFGHNCILTGPSVLKVIRRTMHTLQIYLFRGFGSGCQLFSVYEISTHDIFGCPV